MLVPVPAGRVNPFFSSTSVKQRLRAAKRSCAKRSSRFCSSSATLAQYREQESGSGVGNDSVGLLSIQTASFNFGEAGSSPEKPGTSGKNSIGKVSKLSGPDVHGNAWLLSWGCLHNMHMHDECRTNCRWSRFWVVGFDSNSFHCRLNLPLLEEKQLHLFKFKLKLRE